MIKGVKEGYEKKLEIEGVGYKARLEGNDLILEVGFSHPVKISPPEGIKFEVEKNIITVSGIDKELVGQVAAKIRKVRSPEPYKGKGIRYLGEIIRRKAGKKAVGVAG
jgi:large subunit ribosomal protein L6